MKLIFTALFFICLNFNSQICFARPATPHIEEAPGPYDQAEVYLGARANFPSLKVLEFQGLREGITNVAPWSGDYWPMAKGNIARRYADPDFPDSSDWKENSKWLMTHLGQKYSDRLSPAEKYDLLVGDPQYSLSRKLIGESANLLDEDGNVPSWYGICDGWAAASLMLPRPATSITVTAADGETQITFTPADLKGLASLLWSRGQYEVQSLSIRCDEEINGKRPSSLECRDTNPATFHQVITRRIGIEKHGFVIDLSAGKEVWNHPVRGYRYSYFNPRTQNPVKTLQRATILAAQHPDHALRDLRAPGTKYITGIIMELDYVSETEASLQTSDDQSQDLRNLTTLRYELEQDEEGNIIGGEWIGNYHPDFIWEPMPNTYAVSAGDFALPRPQAWLPERDSRQPLPEEWGGAILRASKQGQPLAAIVNKLVQLSAAGYNSYERNFRGR